MTSYYLCSLSHRCAGWHRCARPPLGHQPNDPPDEEHEQRDSPRAHTCATKKGWRQCEHKRSHVQSDTLAYLRNVTLRDRHPDDVKA